MRPFGEIRLIVFKFGTYTVKTKSIVVSEWPDWEMAGWKILAIDPDDDVAYVFWTEQGHPTLPHIA